MCPFYWYCNRNPDTLNTLAKNRVLMGTLEFRYQSPHSNLHSVCFSIKQIHRQFHQLVFTVYSSMLSSIILMENIIKQWFWDATIYLTLIHYYYFSLQIFHDCPQGPPLQLSEINHTSYCPRNRGLWLGTLSLSFPELIKFKIFCLFFPLALS